MKIFFSLLICSALQAMDIFNPSAPDSSVIHKEVSIPISEPRFVSATRSSLPIPPAASHESISIDIESNHPRINIERTDPPCRKQEAETTKCLCSNKVKLALIAAGSTVASGGIAAVVTWLTMKDICG